ncbi:permease YjgP/YjgQ [Rhodoferax ferrireducens T118]|uniref:Lipopolysaccharide export system permease protein LptF n=1 Tax=Albidiferax ferrireducens (strain ATCC BAA-621 / DSM 15236 / T118) TaxID=338969 RepID=Q21WL4_ALBFT|nr:LPS export ABC transporter permease LptF [Rhodoferax ferrireducens]ABD69839.1 permease YjgP/YjgQ [Rhodoferax ferrireducens T118]
MLFHSSIRKELARSFGATLIVLATVVMTMTLIRTLGQASRGSFNPSDVMLVMGYTVLAYMPTILTMSLFIAIIATLSRMYRDSEMVIWFSSGKGLAALLGPLFRFAWPVLLVVAALALLVLPWSNQRIETLKDQYEKRGDIERIEPGQFQESAGGKRVFFVEKDATGKQAGNNVFIATNEDGKETITSARRGRIETIGQDRFLMLSNGQRLESVLGTSDLKISEFEEYGIKVGKDVLSGSNYVPINTQPTLALFKNQTLPNLAELSWRIGLILAAINFVIIGIAVSGVNPRVGRSANLVFSLFAFVLYYNLLSLGQSWIASGKFTFGWFLAVVHGGALVLGILWLAKGHNNWRWRSLPGAPTLSTSTLRKTPT